MSFGGQGARPLGPQYHQVSPHCVPPPLPSPQSVEQIRKVLEDARKPAVGTAAYGAQQETDDYIDDALENVGDYEDYP